MSRPRPLFALALCCIGGLAWARAVNVEPTEYFDERTGHTVALVRAPLVFLLGRPRGHEKSPDFISLTACEMDQGGVLAHYFVAYAWTEHDPLQQPLHIILDDQTLDLRPLDTFPADLPADRVLLSPGGKGTPRAAYAVSRDMLHAIAASRQVNLSIGDDPQTFELFDGKKALILLVQKLETFKQP